MWRREFVGKTASRFGHNVATTIYATATDLIRSAGVGDGRRSPLMLCLATALLLVAPGAAAYPRPGTNVRISVTEDDSQAVGPKRSPLPDRCCGAEISASGRYIAFNSRAVNLVPHDNNRTTDVFVKDLLTGRVQRVSVASDGAEGHGVCSAKQRQGVGESPKVITVAQGSGAPSISDNGRYVTFTSCATNLVPNDRNLAADVFVHDRIAGRTRRVSVSSSGEETPPDVSTQDTQRVSRNGHGQISGNGRYVAFVSSAGNLVRDDTNGDEDVFVRDLKRGKTGRVSLSSKGEEGTPDGVGSGWAGPAISADGRYVAYVSVLRGLVPEDTNRAADVFVRDRLRHRTERVSIASDGTQADPTGAVVGQSAFPDIPAVLGGVVMSSNGRFVGFDNLAANLIPDDRNHGYDTFVHDRNKRRTSRISVDSEGQEFTAEPDEYAWSLPASMSDSGRFTTFQTWRLKRDVDSDDLFCLIPLQCHRDVYGNFMHDYKTGETELLSDRRRPTRAFAGDTSNGRSIVFVSRESNLVKRDTNGIEDVFLHDRGGDVNALAVHRGTMSRAATPAAAIHPRLTAARLVERHRSRDFFGILELNRMGSISPPAAGVSAAKDVGATYAMDFTVGTRTYEVRVGPSANSRGGRGTSFALFECGNSMHMTCRKIADLQGGYGTTGSSIVFAVPFRIVRFAVGERVRHVHAFHNYATREVEGPVSRSIEGSLLAR